MKKKFAQGAIGTGAGTLAYTMPVSPSPIYIGAVIIVDITNTTAAIINVRVHLVPVGGTPSAANALAYDLPVPAYDVMPVLRQGYHVLNAGDFIQCIGSAAGLTMNISGELTLA